MGYVLKPGTKVSEPLNSDGSFSNGDGSTTFTNVGDRVIENENGDKKFVVSSDVYDNFFEENDDSAKVDPVSVNPDKSKR